MSLTREEVQERLTLAYMFGRFDRITDVVWPLVEAAETTLREFKDDVTGEYSSPGSRAMTTALEGFTREALIRGKG